MDRLSGGTAALVPALVLVAVLLVAPVAAATAPSDTPTGSAGATVAVSSSPPPVAAPADPDGDPVGWEAGYWHNESIDVDQSDGLATDERGALVARSMARVEYIRGLEFRSEVPVSVRSRSAYEANRSGANRSERYVAWNNQVWEALLVVGEDADATERVDSLFGGSVAGFYDAANDEIVVIAGQGGETTVNNATLVHELTHALQDQYHNLSAPRYTADTQDGTLGIQGAVEGEAGYVEAVYAQRCGEAWDCVSAPGSSSTTAPSNLGLYLTVFQPYSDGPAYVDALRERGGWAAVNRTLARPPNASEQTIHLVDDSPTPIAFEDTARDGWETYPSFGENGSDTVGEASIFAGLWYQSRTYGADAVDTRSLWRPTSRFDTYNYSAPPSTGWAGDRLFPYRHNATNRHGYVWETRWDTPTDARQFAAAYIDSLAAHGSREIAPDTYRVSDGPFADTFRIDRRGTAVRVVNGPSAAAVDDIRPTGRSTTVPTPTTDDADRTIVTTQTTTPTTRTDTTNTTSGPVPGFGFAAVFAALAALTALLSRRGV